MYNLLIVDDEPRIVNGLYEQFLDWKQVELGVFRAYSAVEALRILSTTKIDIVLTDIHMPGMSGIELQKKITELWPRCKVIFLTGYSDFEYVQSAMRDGGLDYILKVEGDEPIMAAVSKAITLLQEQLVSEQMLHRAEQQLQAAKPMIQKEYLTSLLQGELSVKSIDPTRFRELQIPLSAEARVLLAVCRVDRWPEQIRPTDRPLMMYAIQNVADEYFSTLRMLSVSIRPSYLVWLIQPVCGGTYTGEEWDKCLSFVSGTLSDIQETCKTMLKLPVSFSLSGAPCAWESAAAQLLRLEQLFQQGLGLGQEMLLTDLTPQQQEPSSVIQGLSKQDITLRLRTVKQLEAYLLSGQKDDFQEQYREIAETARLLQASPSLFPFVVEIQYALASMFLSYINQWGFLDTVASAMDTGLLLRGGSFGSWAEAEAYFSSLSELLFTQRSDDQQDRTQKILTAVNQFIEQHLAEDLSLERLAEHVYLHPTYLSRLYKQIAGVRLSDYIKDMRLAKAKELLANPRLKVHEVAVSVGFESAHYFTKVFKKELLLTPQEYRDRF